MDEYFSNLERQLSLTRRLVLQIYQTSPANIEKRSNTNIDTIVYEGYKSIILEGLVENGEENRNHFFVS